MVVKRRNDRNRYLIKVFAWLEKKGRSPSMYPMDSLPNDYVQLEPIEKYLNHAPTFQPPDLIIVVPQGAVPFHFLFLRRNFFPRFHHRDRLA